jgi:DNA-binding CsgD family transcriptional regulator
MGSGNAHGESLSPPARRCASAAPRSKVLTAQEEQISRLARDGLSNPEISGQILITAHTVE